MQMPISNVQCAVAHIPSSLFIMTAAHEEQAYGVLVRWVQRCSEQPPMVVIALEKGQRIDPLIRDSRAFVLCQISAADRFLARKFQEEAARSSEDDPFVCLSTHRSPSGSPIIDRAMCWLDCELARTVELDSEFRLYVGQIHHGGVLNKGEPAICFGDDDNHPGC